MDETEVGAAARPRLERTGPTARRRTPPADPSLLPPGPRLPRIVQSIGMMRFRHRWVPWLHARYGEGFTVRLFPSTRNIVLFSEPATVREIFAGDPEVFHAGEANAILGPVMGEHSVLLVDGAEHRRARALLTPAFSGRALRGYADLVTGLARTEVGSWVPGVPFRMLDRMNALTLEVILRVVFGVTDEARLARLRPLVRDLVEVSPLVLLGWAVPRLRRVGMWRRAVENTAALDALLYAEIAERRRSPDLATRSDVLSTLVRVEDHGERLDDAELRDQLVTLLLAGHETTATALAWTLHEVGLDPALRERARAAARSGDDAYLEVLVKEAMRLHPVIPMVVRVLRRPATLGGVDLPAGTTVAASIILAHRRPASHPRPEAFDPARFVGGQPAPNTWIPFGGGVRRCLGASFSLMEAVAVLREVLTAHEVEAVAPEGPRVRNITSVPRDGAHSVVR
ncbi:cytochrome P450 [Phycicoccus sp.]|uniref:cytochrome P450 n=1 Tax=Phycicoccus sp. TaxID=1902410 RepID=UPI002C6F547A|nr:cytochrome P450 [Phycicoccus sp.]HMM97121.1 cytochrome P450 [Phycicoccus sp.]